MEPGFEPASVSKRVKISPGTDEAGLDDVFGGMVIAQDAKRDREASVADLTDKAIERVDVTALRADDELVDHGHLRPTTPG
jgi:ribonuclease HIII